jgi:uncharacterized membrane protein
MAADRIDHALERLVFFSDAVFAIAITLLVIEIHIPEVPRGAGDSAHLEALAHLIPSFVGFLISFFVIGAFWIGHHRYCALAAHYHPRILGWNLALLCVIAFMPFVTAYGSAFMGERVPTILYCSTLFVAALLNIKVNRTATSPPMVGEQVTPEQIAYVRRRSLALLLGAGTAVMVSIVFPPIGQAGLASIPLWRQLLIALEKKRSARAGQAEGPSP